MKTQNGLLLVYDVPMLLNGDEGAELFRTQSESGALIKLEFNSDGSMLATRGFEGRVFVWDATDGTRLAEFETDLRDLGPIAFHPERDELAIGWDEDTIQIEVLDPAQLVAIARERVTRPLNPAECLGLRIDPCPTLAELKSGSA